MPRRPDPDRSRRPSGESQTIVPASRSTRRAGGSHPGSDSPGRVPDASRRSIRGDRSSRDAKPGGATRVSACALGILAALLLSPLAGRQAAGRGWDVRLASRETTSQPPKGRERPGAPLDAEGNRPGDPPPKPGAPSNPHVLAARLVEPRETWWVGRVSFAAEVEASAADPVERVEFRLDGRFAWVVTKPPYRWSHDFGEVLSIHRLEILVRTRSGATATVRAESRAPSLQQRAGIELILVPVSVRDPSGLPVRGLSREDFLLFEDGVPRPIATFDSEATPVSLVFGLDCSGSMQRYFPFVKGAAVEFVRRLPPVFQISLLAFGKRPEPVGTFTFERSPLYYGIDRLRATGSGTALLDASRAAVNALRRRPGRRAVAIFTDGQDTVVPEEEQDAFASRVLSEARAAGVAFYYVGYGWIGRADLLERIAGGTGGEYLSAGGARRIAAAFDRIANTLDTQYTLGCEIGRAGQPGEWRSLRVEVRRPGVTVAARPGYALP